MFVAFPVFNDSIFENVSFLRIQCLWKGAIARKRVKQQRAEELVFIGMVGHFGFNYVIPSY
jgi:hypothetical protein